jgi:hypothetical protein
MKVSPVVRLGDPRAGSVPTNADDRRCVIHGEHARQDRAELRAGEFLRARPALR